jgi:hypothetical protein
MPERTAISPSPILNEDLNMTPEQNFQFRHLLSNLLNARVTGESDERQLAHEDHLRNYVDGLLEEKDAAISALKVLPSTFTDSFSDEVFEPITEELLDALSEAWADGVGSGLYEAMKRWHRDELILPQLARQIDESDWPLPKRLAKAHEAFMRNWEGTAYEGRHSQK